MALFVSPCEVCESSVYLCPGLSICMLVNFTLTFTENSDCDEINRVLSVTGINTILLKLIQMIYVNVRPPIIDHLFNVVSLSLSLSLYSINVYA